MADRQRMPLGLAAFMGLFILLLIALVFTVTQRGSQFDRHGVETMATFVSGRSQRTGSDPTKPIRWNHYATVRYEAEGRMLTTEERVSADFLESARPGMRIPILYLAGDPENVLVDPAYESGRQILGWLFLVFFSGCLLYPVLRRLRAKRKQ